MCLDLYEEISEVLLQSEKLRRWLAIDKANGFLIAIRELVNFVPNPPDVDVGLRDRADSYIVALARQERCKFIVTGDRDLLEWSDQSPPCVTPKEFLSRL
jgi:putative PIN family toxin of toxin-antitoxin system